LDICSISTAIKKIEENSRDAEIDDTEIIAHQLQPKSWWKGRLNVKDASHPHLGARHPNGTLQMIINPSTDHLMDPINAMEIKISGTFKN
jgi:hypothetical protein